MKIAIDANELTLKTNSGVKVYTEELIKELQQIDKRNDYILYTSEEIETLNFYNHNKDNFSINTRHTNLPFWTYTKLPQEINKDKPDLLFMPIQTVPFIRKPKDIKIVATVHDIAFFIFPNHFTLKDRLLLNFHTKRALKTADIVIAPSSATKEDIIRFYNIKEDKIKIVYHGVRLLSDRAVSNKNSMSKNDAYILFVGSIQPRKNIISLIAAFDKTKKISSFQHLKLVICGGKGWLSNKTYTAAKKSKFSKDIIFTGSVNNKRLTQLYKNAEIFVMPSLYEGFCLPVVEAMSFGLPCIVSKNSSLAEIASDSAMQIDPNNASDIAEKMTLLLKNDYLRNKFSMKGLKRSSKFSWRKSAVEHLKIFSSLV